MHSTTITQVEEVPKRKTEDFVPEKVLYASDTVQPLLWKNIIGIAILHFLAFYAFATSYHEAKLWTWIFSKFEFY